MSDFVFSPIGDRVIVKPDSLETVSKSGIAIPQTSDGDEPTSGVVVALGAGGTWKDCPNPIEFLSVGMRVWFNKYAGEDLEIRDDSRKKEAYKILRLDAIYGFERV